MTIILIIKCRRRLLIFIISEGLIFQETKGIEKLTDYKTRNFDSKQMEYKKKTSIKNYKDPKLKLN